MMVVVLTKFLFWINSNFEKRKSLKLKLKINFCTLKRNLSILDFQVFQLFQVPDPTAQLYITMRQKKQIKF